MAYTLPQFNTLMDVWPAGQTPAGGPFAYQIDAQFYIHSRMDIDVDELGLPGFVPNILIRTDKTIKDNEANVVNKCILGFKDASGFDCYYIVKWWDWMHYGFTNQYLCLFCWQCDDNGISPDNRRG